VAFDGVKDGGEVGGGLDEFEDGEDEVGGWDEVESGEGEEVRRTGGGGGVRRRGRAWFGCGGG